MKRLLRRWGRPSRILRAALAAASLVLAGCGDDEPPAPPPAETEPAPAPPPPPEPEPEPPPPPPPPRPAYGALEVTGTEGAEIRLGGRELGVVPGEFTGLSPGEYRLRVEKPDFHPFDLAITIRAGQTRAVDVQLVERLGSIAVESDPAGAIVFVNRRFRGNTPVIVEDLQPGSYGITVSAEGYPVHTQEVVVAREQTPVRVEFTSVERTLNVQVGVVHKHRFGSCAGILVADAEGIAYRTDHQDAFEVAFGRLERFEIDYVANNLRLKIREGRNYNFEAPNANTDPLFVFHRDVTAFRDATQ